MQNKSTDFSRTSGFTASGFKSSAYNSFHKTTEIVRRVATGKCVARHAW